MIMSDKKQPTISWVDNNPEAQEILAKANNILDVKDSYNQYLNLNTDSSSEKKKKVPPKLSFTYDNNLTENIQGVKAKRKLLPDTLIKEIASSNHLIASIIRSWSNVISMYGKFRKDRFDLGLEIKIIPEYEEEMSPEQITKVKERMARFKTLLIKCGYEEGLVETQKLGLSNYLYMLTTNALKFGKIATEVVYHSSEEDADEENGRYHRHRPLDAGTIYRTFKTTHKEVESARRVSVPLLNYEAENNAKLEDFPEVDYSEVYPWVQMMDGFKKNYFSQKELLVYNFFPSTDVEHNGYPLTPIDTCITAITTHLSIEAYTKLFFLNGRGAKGIFVINSDEVDQSILEDFKQQFNATVNNVNNSFRTPFIGLGVNDKITWQPVDASSKDGEFQFLYDQVSRNILSSFGMSPDELPGYGHLSKGTNSQALSESNNEYKLTAARDVGLRPLVMKMQDFFNQQLFPIIDAELSQICVIEFAGLDASSRDQENARLEQESGLYLTYDDLLSKVDKTPVGDHLGGNIPFNERWQGLADKYLTVGSINANFNNDPASIIDPLQKYRRDGFFFQHLEFLLQLDPSVVKSYFAVNPVNMDIYKIYLNDYLEENKIDDENKEVFDDEEEHD
jgi:hypothetical protein